MKVSPGAASPVSTATTLTPCGGLGHRVFYKCVLGVCLILSCPSLGIS